MDRPSSVPAGESERSPLTKAELRAAVADTLEIPRELAAHVVESIFDGIVGALRRGEHVQIRGFGTFRIRQRRPRLARNPRTGVSVNVPAKKVPYFRPGKELLENLNPKVS